MSSEIQIIQHESGNDLLNFELTVIQLRDYYDRHFVFSLDQNNNILINLKQKKFISFKRGRTYFLTFISQTQDCILKFNPQNVLPDMKNLMTVIFPVSLEITDQLPEMFSVQFASSSIPAFILPTRSQRRNEIKENKKVLKNLLTPTLASETSSSAKTGQTLEFSSLL